MKETHTITDRKAIMKALCFPSSMPESFKVKPLVPIGMSKFKGDNMPSSWSVNDQFEKGKEYPVYDNEGVFVIGKDGIGKKMVPVAWTKIKPL